MSRKRVFEEWRPQMVTYVGSVENGRQYQIFATETDIKGKIVVADTAHDAIREAGIENPYKILPLLKHTLDVIKEGGLEKAETMVEENGTDNEKPESPANMQKAEDQ